MEADQDLTEVWVHLAERCLWSPPSSSVRFSSNRHHISLPGGCAERCWTTLKICWCMLRMLCTASRPPLCLSCMEQATLWCLPPTLSSCFNWQASQRKSTQSMCPTTIFILTKTITNESTTSSKPIWLIKTTTFNKI